jgi:nicotinate-nucleotide adenylyltransferase
MTRLAIEGEAGFEISLIDAPRPAGTPNYTLDTLQRLREELPAGCELFFLMGADSLAGLRQWHRAAEIPFAANMIVASRPGESDRELKTLLPEGLKLEGADCGTMHSTVAMRCYSIGDGAGRWASFYLLPELAEEISATDIRAGIREASLTRGPRLLPPEVEAYVREHGLYR